MTTSKVHTCFIFEQLCSALKETFPFCIYRSPGNGKTVIIAWIHKRSNYSNLYMIYSFVNSYFSSSNWIAAQMSRMSIASQKEALNYHLKHIICQLNTKCSTYWKSQNPHIFHFILVWIMHILCTSGTCQFNSIFCSKKFTLCIFYSPSSNNLIQLYSFNKPSAMLSNFLYLEYFLSRIWTPNDTYHST